MFYANLRPLRKQTEHELSETNEHPPSDNRLAKQYYHGHEDTLGASWRRENSRAVHPVTSGRSNTSANGQSRTRSASARTGLDTITKAINRAVCGVIRYSTGQKARAPRGDTISYSRVSTLLHERIGQRESRTRRSFSGP